MPAGQVRQVVELVPGAYVPSGHRVQVEALAWPKVPAGQASQASRFVDGTKPGCSAGRWSRHSCRKRSRRGMPVQVAAFCLPKVPGRQSSQASRAGLGTVPDRQVSQIVAPLELVKVPTGQSRHVMAPMIST